MYQNFYYDHYEVGKVIVALHKDFANQIAIRDIRSVLDEGPNNTYTAWGRPRTPLAARACRIPTEAEED